MPILVFMLLVVLFAMGLGFAIGASLTLHGFGSSGCVYVFVGGVCCVGVLVGAVLRAASRHCALVAIDGHRTSRC